MDDDFTADCFCTEYVTKIKWRIKEFSIHASCTDSSFFLQSKKFLNLFKTRLAFCLQFYPIDEKDFSGVYLIPISLDNEKSVELTYKFHIENSAGDQIGKHGESSSVFTSDMAGYGPLQFVKRDELYSKESNFIKEDDVVYICCEIKRNSNQANFKPIKLSTRPGLYLFESHQTEESGICKIEINMNSNKTLKVDKSILSLHSDVFAAMLKNEYEEGKNSVIQMSDSNETVLESFFSSLYVGYVYDSEFADELLILADKYHINWMKEECEEILGKDLSMENIFDRLHLASTYNCSSLKVSVIHFASQTENFGQIVKSNRWSEFTIENKDFASEIWSAAFENLKILAKSSDGETSTNSNE